MPTTYLSYFNKAILVQHGIEIQAHFTLTLKQYFFEEKQKPNQTKATHFNDFGENKFFRRPNSEPQS